MENRVKTIFNEIILTELAGRFGIERQFLHNVSDSESFVYEFEQAGQEFILRITHNSHRSYEQISAEFDWISYLTANGVRVSGPVLSEAGNTIETFNTGNSEFLAAVFEKAPGREIQRKNWTDDFFLEWGRYVGRLHNLAKDYIAPQRPALERPQWNEEYNVARAATVLDNQPKVLDRQQEMMAYLQNLPRNKDSYGLIHSDLEDDNFFIDGESITAFDFDECHYNWFVYDLAAILRESTWRLAFPEGQSKDDIILRFWGIFSRGYLSANDLSQSWIEQLPMFLRWREICMYVYACGKCEIGPEDEEIMSVIKNRIINGIPLPQLDVEMLCNTFFSGRD